MRNSRGAILRLDIWEIANFTHKGDWEIQSVPYNPGEFANLIECNFGKKVKSAEVGHQAGAYPGFCSMK